MFVCKFCGKECRNNSGLTQHQNSCSKNPDKKYKKMYSERRKKECSICGRLIDASNIFKHEKSCCNADRKTTLKIDSDNCPYCGFICKNKGSLVNHILTCKRNPDRIDRKESYKERYKNLDQASKDRMKWNKGLTKETDERVASYSSKLIGRKNIHDYLYQEHNDNEICKWLEYVNSLDISIPSYKKIEGTDYNRVWKEKDKKLCFEHNFLMNIVLDGNLETKNTVHHIDKNGLNNSLDNLMVFETNSEHKRFHNSRFAYIVYNEITHKFNCFYIKN